MAIAMASCGKAPREPRAAWRDEAERACLRSGAARESAYVVAASSIDGPGACGALQPFHVSALAEGKVGLTFPASLSGRGHKAYAATLTCAMVPALESWMIEKVQTAAAAVYGQPVVEMHSLGSYSCRRMNNGTGTSTMSEHAFANAIDVSGFTLADGREVMVRSGWRGTQEDQEFLRSVFVGSCDIFHTVLGPGSDGHHEDHFHLDLMRHASGRHVCRPVIKFSPRTAAPLEAPVQPPVAPGQMQQEPEADDPYALDDTAPPARGALASSREALASSGEPAQAPSQAAALQRPMQVAVRPLPAYPSSALPVPVRPSPADLNEQAQGAPLPISSKGDRLDRAGAARRAQFASPVPSSAGSVVVAKDASRLGAPDPSAQQPRQAYASLPPRPPGLVPAPPLPPRPINAAAAPGWSVGAQPVIRQAPARGAAEPEPTNPDADPDE
jgi:hypothetical protein